MASKPYSLFRRQATKGHIYYARFTRPDRTRTTLRSTECTNIPAAERWVLDHLDKHGVPSASDRGLPSRILPRDRWEKLGSRMINMIRGCRRARRSSDRCAQAGGSARDGPASARQHNGLC
jgi:hypothetical protein